MSRHLISVFPQPLLIEQFSPSIELLEFLKSQELEPKDTQILSMYGQMSKNVMILREPQCAELRKFIIDTATFMAKEILTYNIESMVDVLSWVSIKEPNQSHVPHIHPNSLISGVFYFDDCIEQQPAINFSLPPSNGLIIAVPKTINKESTFGNENFSFRPAKNQLVMFPSSLHHSVSPNQSGTNRYSLAFNLLPKNVLGARDSLTMFKYEDGL